MDRIILSGIEIYAHGGVSEAEKQVGQRYSIDVILELDLSAAAGSDAIEDTVHYDHVHTLVVDTARERPFNLIENVAGRIAENLLRHFPLERVTVRCEKLLPPIEGVVRSAAVELTRYRS
jgi:dihydroneopterin aldolase